MFKRVTIATLLCAVLALGGCASASSSSGSAAQSASAESAAQASTSASAAKPAVADCPILLDEQFGNVRIVIPIDEFNALGFAYGDSVDIEFSNGFAITVPYYNGYYGRVGQRMLVAYPGSDYPVFAESFGESMWEAAGVSESDTATIRLAEAGAYADMQESFNVVYSDNRADYASDAAFANFRSMAGGALAPDVVYRSASPIDDKHNRAAYVEQLMGEAGIRFVLDLADSDAEIEEAVAEDAEKGVDVSYFDQLHKEGNVAAINLAANYPSREFAEKLVGGLVALSEHDGPYLVHCAEGKDRTGFVCMLLEALAGASYDEMLADYMATFDNYYGITEQTDPMRFSTIASTNFDCMLEHLLGAEDADLRSADYVEPARAYLRMGGMTDEQIDALVARITESAPAASAGAMPIKVLILPKFEIGAMTGDDYGEAQHYCERFLQGSREYEIDGGFADHKLFVKDGVALYVTGVGKANAALSTIAVLADDRFDFSDAYILSTGCAGAAKGYAVMGDVCVATALCDADLGHKVDARELADPEGTTWFHDGSLDSAAFVELDRALAGKAFDLVKDMPLNTTDLTRRIMRENFPGETWALRGPQVILGTNISSDQYWKGEFEHRNALNIAETYDADDPFAMTEMEDIAIALTLKRFGLLDRLIVIRGAVNMDVFLGDDTPEALWGTAASGKTEAGDSLTELDIFPVALENTYVVGSRIVDAILDGSL